MPERGSDPGRKKPTPPPEPAAAVSSGPPEFTLPEIKPPSYDTLNKEYAAGVKGLESAAVTVREWFSDSDKTISRRSQVTMGQVLSGEPRASFFHNLRLLEAGTKNRSLDPTDANGLYTVKQLSDLRGHLDEIRTAFRNGLSQEGIGLSTQMVAQTFSRLDKAVFQPIEDQIARLEASLFTLAAPDLTLDDSDHGEEESVDPVSTTAITEGADDAGTQPEQVEAAVLESIPVPDGVVEKLEEARNAFLQMLSYMDDDVVIGPGVYRGSDLRIADLSSATNHLGKSLNNPQAYTAARERFVGIGAAIAHAIEGNPRAVVDAEVFTSISKEITVFFNAFTTAAQERGVNSAITSRFLARFDSLVGTLERAVADARTLYRLAGDDSVGYVAGDARATGADYGSGFLPGPMTREYGRETTEALRAVGDLSMDETADPDASIDPDMTPDAVAHAAPEVDEDTPTVDVPAVSVDPDPDQSADEIDLGEPEIEPNGAVPDVLSDDTLAAAMSALDAKKEVPRGGDLPGGPVAEQGDHNVTPADQEGVALEPAASSIMEMRSPEGRTASELALEVTAQIKRTVDHLNSINWRNINANSESDLRSIDDGVAAISDRAAFWLTSSPDAWSDVHLGTLARAMSEKVMLSEEIGDTDRSAMDRALTELKKLAGTPRVLVRLQDQIERCDRVRTREEGGPVAFNAEQFAAAQAIYEQLEELASPLLQLDLSVWIEVDSMLSAIPLLPHEGRELFPALVSPLKDLGSEYEVRLGGTSISSFINSQVRGAAPETLPFITDVQHVLLSLTALERALFTARTLADNREHSASEYMQITKTQRDETLESYVKMMSHLALRLEQRLESMKRQLDSAGAGSTSLESPSVPADAVGAASTEAPTGDDQTRTQPYLGAVRPASDFPIDPTAAVGAGADTTPADADAAALTQTRKAIPPVAAPEPGPQPATPDSAATRVATPPVSVDASAPTPVSTPAVAAPTGPDTARPLTDPLVSRGDTQPSAAPVSAPTGPDVTQPSAAAVAPEPTPQPWQVQDTNPSAAPVTPESRPATGTEQVVVSVDQVEVGGEYRSSGDARRVVVNREVGERVEATLFDATGAEVVRLLRTREELFEILQTAGYLRVE